MITKAWVVVGGVSFDLCHRLPELAQPAKRTMSTAHKKALSESRPLRATVDAYLAAINVPNKR